MGDGYLVASGLPYPNGKMVLALLYVLDHPDKRSFQHAKEISSMAILLMQLVGRFQVSHMRNYRMQMRMGIHSGMEDEKPF